MENTTKLVLSEQIKNHVTKLREALQEQDSRKKQAKRLNELINQAEKEADACAKEKVVIEQALSLIIEAGDQVAQESYLFITRSVNNLLEKMFVDCRRTVRLTQKMVGKNPTLAVEVVADGVVRDLGDSSGHGIAQIISLICVSCLIVLNNSRRIVVLDEVLSGVQIANRPVLAEMLWAFTDIGFQFILCESEFVPEGAKVYKFVNNSGVSTVEEVYIKQAG